ncbi:hypothetical protein NPIL_695801 [Nephila pilipes]|uniref:Uncharacterized protein n=1 Tax=Nephila pilipes TaxID=299642 RepID=A0A8X6N813_NEPPI|nr:hypothetical protein NPIL_695801 [Nephila pilipes]
MNVLKLDFDIVQLTCKTTAEYLGKKSFKAHPCSCLTYTSKINQEKKCSFLFEKLRYKMLTMSFLNYDLMLLHRSQINSNEV